MRALQETGWASFRLRQVLASFAIHLLNLHWQDVAVLMGEQFRDYCPGIHWPKMALQAGVIETEKPLPVLNPLQEALILDPDEHFVRAWLPGLRSVPRGFGHRPWQYPDWRGLSPIVDINTAFHCAIAITEGTLKPSECPDRLVPAL